MKIFSIHRKTAVILLSAGACLAVIITVFLWRGLFDRRGAIPEKSTADTDSGESNSSTLELTDSVIARLLIENLPGDLPFSNVVAHIGAEGTVGIDCTLSPDALTEFCRSHNVDIPAAVRLMISLLPDSVPASFSFRLALDSESGHLSLTPKSFSVNGMELSSTLLPKELEVNISQAVNSFFLKDGRKIESIGLADGKITITLTEK